MGNYAEATWSDGNVTGEAVIWDAIAPEQYATPGNTFTVHGKVRGHDVSTTVTVRGEAPTVPVESVTIDGDGVKDGKITLYTGGTVTLNATVKPDNATKKTVTWSSSSSYIASVTGDGKITANKVGTATITASAGGKTASITVTIPDRFKDVPNGKSFHDEIEWLAANKISQGNNDGTYGYGKTLSRQDMAIFLYRMAKLEHVEGAAEFAPSEADYAKFKDVKRAYGYGKTLSRQDMAIFLYRMAKLEHVEGAAEFAPSEADYAKFKDVKRGSFAAKEILWLAKVGITQGSNGRFNGNQTLTRQDMAIFLYRFAKLAGSASATEFAPSEADYAKFKDVKRDSFAAKEILWLANERITLGNSDGTFGGNSTEFAPSEADYAKFKDVKRDSFAAKEILWLANERITLGNSDGTFGGNSKLSREAMAAFLYRIHTHLTK